MRSQGSRWCGCSEVVDGCHDVCSDIRVCHYSFVMTKRGFIQVRVSVEEKAAIGAAAGAAGLGVSEWLRRVCLRAAGEGLPLVSSAEFRGSVEAMSEAQLAASRVALGAVEESVLSKSSRAQIELLKENDRRVVKTVEGIPPRFVVPASCPAPSKKTFRPDFK